MGIRAALHAEVRRVAHEDRALQLAHGFGKPGGRLVGVELGVVFEMGLGDGAVEARRHARGSVVAALADAAEGELAAGADGALVPVQDARADSAHAVLVAPAIPV